MNIWKKTVLFYLGGEVYMLLEFLWRGRSHGSMFLLGGLCFSMLGRLGELPIPLTARALLGSLGITALELLTGFTVNRDYSVWDYRKVPLNFRGQICLPYSLLWLPLSFAGIVVYGRAQEQIRRLTFSKGSVK